MPEKYSITQIADLINGQLFSTRNDNISIVEILTDSRKLVTPHKSLFFALNGPRNDGHKYIAELYAKGVRNFVISQKGLNLNLYEKSNFILVKDTLQALQKLAAEHRKRFSCPVIGITGSNGKTIVKEWLYQLLSKDYNIVRSPKSYNSQIGVPLSVWELNGDHHLAIFEAGISEPEEMDVLQNIIQPDIGIFTNIGHAHDASFINRVQKAGEKFKLFRNASKIIYSPDYPEISEVFARSGLHEDIESFTWSRKNASNLWAKTVIINDGKAKIVASVQGKEEYIEIPFCDNASIENALMCWAVMLSLEYPSNVIRERMSNLQNVEMRLELKEGVNNCSVINDSYSLDIDSLLIALDFLLMSPHHNKRTVIMSDILQSGISERNLYQNVADILKEKQIDRLIGIGTAISRFPELFTMATEFYPDTKTFLQNMTISSFKDENILLKGARIFSFERINNALQKKDHETVMEVNMEAVVSNLNVYRKMINPYVKIMAMVKAFSYGSGSVEIASLLQFHNVDYLAVAFADEGIELRQNGISMPILVLNPEKDSFNSILKYNLEPEIYNFKSFNNLLLAIDESGHENGDKARPIHIKIDTGMHRLGFMPSDIPTLVNKIIDHPEIVVKSVFSHLAASGNPAEDEFTLEQINRFNNLSNLIIKGLNYPVMRHILNSDGIVRFPDNQFDMVRLGISLYGVSSIKKVQNSLIPVCTLKSVISQIKEIPSGESVGYNRAFVATRNTTIAIVPIGYADGLNRALSNGVGQFLVKNKLVPVIGDICMDMCMIDITDIGCAEGDEVIIFNHIQTVSKISEKIGTIPYEILSSISRRVKRVYYH